MSLLGFRPSLCCLCSHQFVYVASLLSGGREGQERDGGNSHLPGAGRLVAGWASIGCPGAFAIERSLPAGHVQAALTIARRLELPRLLDRSPSRERDLVLAMICQRAMAPASKLGTVRAFGQSTLADELGVADADEDDLYAAMDWLLERQERIEDRLARRPLTDGELGAL